MNWQAIDRRSLNRSDWDALISGHTFFSTIQWVDICTDGLGKQAQAVFLCGFDGDHLTCALPGIVTVNWGMRSFYSLPYGTYGGIIWGRDVAPGFKNEALVHLSAYFRKARFTRVSIADYDGSLREWTHTGIKRQPAFTHLIDISGDTYRPADKKIEQHIQIGLKAEPEIAPVQTSRQVGQFYALYEATEKRHGRSRPILPRRMFDALFDHLSGNEMLYWIAIMVDGIMIGSQINFIFGDSLINWQTVSDYEMRQYKPNHLLLNNAITYAQSRGVRQINLGASPPEASGLIDFKERWGGVRREYEILSLTAPWLKMLEKWR
jgi:hypothetical protein